ncbi:MAG: 6,7-dimethyl-8-ribityllumazine synthase [Thermogutta sp.]
MQSVIGMPVGRIFGGDGELPPGRFAIIVSRFNESITKGLLHGALQTLTTAGVAPEQIDVFWVPGAFEIPLVAKRLAVAHQHLAILCLGAVIKGETTHDQHINRAVSLQLAEIGCQTGVPVLFGILTCNTVDQAMARSAPTEAVRNKDQSSGKVGNKGAECALAALEMVRLLHQINQVLDTTSLAGEGGKGI